MKVKVPLIIGVLPFLAACGSLESSGIRCPVLPPFTKAQQAAVAGELNQDGPETRAMLENYVRLRQACEAHIELDQ